MSGGKGAIDCDDTSAGDRLWQDHSVVASGIQIQGLISDSVLMSVDDLTAECKILARLVLNVSR
ncbi:hypothetical protein CVM73_35140 [Bradyrhizobium forestalis]|uniref:Uncharacterized protein n=1 Tax=Bradyrhizobium forestalis TaxID=1419263 RepID=A0A2M8QYI3_9BRAD|nr:hypothetical protein CVM73_35140 [Bradyrhizobium forestalis]